MARAEFTLFLKATLGNLSFQDVMEEIELTIEHPDVVSHRLIESEIVDEDENGSIAKVVVDVLISHEKKLSASGWDNLTEEMDVYFKHHYVLDSRLEGFLVEEG